MIRCIYNLIAYIRWFCKMTYNKDNKYKTKSYIFSYRRSIKNDTNVTNFTQIIDTKILYKNYNQNIIRNDTTILDIDDGYGWYYFLE